MQLAVHLWATCGAALGTVRCCFGQLAVQLRATCGAALANEPSSFGQLAVRRPVWSEFSLMVLCAVLCRGFLVGYPYAYYEQCGLPSFVRWCTLLRYQTALLVGSP